MGGGSGNKAGYKGDDAEDMCGSTLEPDPRYDSCCSNIFRPGKVLRDIVKGLLVVLAIAVVIAVVFVIIFYVVPATTAHESPEATPSAAGPTEITIVSVSSTGPGTRVEVKSSESEVTHLPPTSTPSLLDVLGTHAAPAEDTNGNCRPRSLEMCSDLPYALTSLPNWANDKSDYDLHNASLPFFRDVIVRSSCSPRAREYSCAILEPQCGANGAIIPPCRTFCRSVASTCQEFVIKGFGLSDVFECDRFPDSTDPAVCFDATQAPVGDAAPAASDSSFQHLPNPEVARTGARDFPIENYTTLDYPEAVLEGQVPPADDYPVYNDYSVTEDYPEGPQDYVTDNFDYTEVVDSSAVTLPPVDEFEGHVDAANESLTVDEEPFLQDFVDINTESAPAEAFVPTEEPITSEAQDFVAEGDFISTDGPVLICDHEKFLCQNGFDCVDLAAVCDGLQQCSDGSDEANCTSIGCPNDDFKCATTDICIPKSWLCDGADDCRDNSDETDCDFLQSSPTDQLETLAPLGQFPYPREENRGGEYSQTSSEDLANRTEYEDAAGGFFPESAGVGEVIDGNVLPGEPAPYQEALVGSPSSDEGIPPPLTYGDELQVFPEDVSEEFPGQYPEAYSDEAVSPQGSEQFPAGGQDGETQFSDAGFQQYPGNEYQPTENYQGPSDYEYQSEESYPELTDYQYQSQENRQEPPEYQYQPEDNYDGSSEYQFQDSSESLYQPQDNYQGPPENIFPEGSFPQAPGVFPPEEIQPPLDFQNDDSLPVTQQPLPELPQENNFDVFSSAEQGFQTPLGEQQSSPGEYQPFQEQPAPGSDYQEFQEQPAPNGEFQQFQEQPALNGDFQHFQEQPTLNGDYQQFPEQPAQNGEFQQFQEQPFASGDFQQFQDQPVTPDGSQQFQEQPAPADDFQQFGEQPATDSFNSEQPPQPAFDTQQDLDSFQQQESEAPVGEQESFDSENLPVENIPTNEDVAALSETQAQSENGLLEGDPEPVRSKDKWYEDAGDLNVPEALGSDLRVEGKESAPEESENSLTSDSSATQTEDEEKEQENESPFLSRLRGASRFPNLRRPLTRRPQRPTQRPTQAQATSRAPSSSDTTESFRSRFQKWRSSRLPPAPSYESLRLNALREHENSQLDTAEESPEVAPRPAASHTSTITRRPLGIRTSRITSRLNPFTHHEELLKENVESEESALVLPEEEEQIPDSELAQSTNYNVQVSPPVLQSTYDNSQYNPQGYDSLARQGPPFIPTQDSPYNANQRLREYNPDVARRRLDNHSPYHLSFNHNQYSQGNTHK